jgi:hypothetical protein
MQNKCHQPKSKHGQLLLLVQEYWYQKLIERDVNAPKRNMSAYLLYQNAMRDDVSKTTVC